MNFISTLKLHELARKRRALCHWLNVYAQRQRMAGAESPVHALIVAMRALHSEEEELPGENAPGDVTNVRSFLKKPPNQ